jgi:hypothetical protein
MKNRALIQKIQSKPIMPSIREFYLHVWMGNRATTSSINVCPTEQQFTNHIAKDAKLPAASVEKRLMLLMHCGNN